MASSLLPSLPSPQYHVCCFTSVVGGVKVHCRWDLWLSLSTQENLQVKMCWSIFCMLLLKKFSLKSCLSQHLESKQLKKYQMLFLLAARARAPRLISVLSTIHHLVKIMSIWPNYFQSYSKPTVVSSFLLASCSAACLLKIAFLQFNELHCKFNWTYN